jgi:hypothetical protein
MYTNGTIGAMNQDCNCAKQNYTSNDWKSQDVWENGNIWNTGQNEISILFLSETNFKRVFIEK